ncbi:MAG TPA: hypothetical protein VHI13_09280 [Candidatus Kapabacteria bacterium]|nr:hypothetical protein [Candidatus Kapabacteria bacterium]
MKRNTTYLRLLPVVLGLVLACGSAANAQRTGPCDSCASLSWFLDGWVHRPLSDTTFYLESAGQGTLVRGVRRLQRTTVTTFGRPQQAVHVWYDSAGACRDTVVAIAEPLALRRGGVGGSYEPVSIAVLPAREFYCGDPPAGEGMLLSVGAIGGYAGSDTSSRAIGFRSVYGGARVLAGLTVATDVRAALGLEALSEGGRLRIPLLAHVRWYPFGGTRTERYFRYAPSDCQFGRPGDPPAAPQDPRCEAASGTGTRLDSSVYFVQDTRRVRRGFRPFLYGEAGLVLNGRFDGAGSTPSLNPSDYGQVLAGAGIGVPLFGPVVLSVGYRYMRLNLRTPCETCTGQFVVNTNRSHAVTASLAFEFE